MFKKTDRVVERGALTRLERLHPSALFTCATSGVGLDGVRQAILAVVESHEEVVDVVLPAGDGRTASLLHEQGEVLSRTEEGDAVHLRVRLPKPDAERLRKQGVVPDA